MKKLNRHEKLSIILGIIAVILLIISCCPGGYEQATGILQGIATGFISGVILFFISAAKSREEKEIADIREDLIIIQTYFSDISDIFSAFDILRLIEIGMNNLDLYNKEFSKEFLNLYNSLKERNKTAPFGKILTTMPSSQFVYTTLGNWLNRTMDNLMKKVKDIDPSFHGVYFEDYLSFFEDNADATDVNDFLNAAYRDLSKSINSISTERNNALLLLCEIEKQQKRINNSII